jgi:hypothetical protein
MRMGFELKTQLTGSYDRGAAVTDMSGDLGWFALEHTTLRKRANRCARLGYTFSEIDRETYADDIHAINVSTPERQGRPMSNSYLERPVYGPSPERICAQHHVYTYGLHRPEGAGLAAYLWLYRSGDLALVSSILGHADELENEIMYRLYACMLREQWPLGGTVFYNLWNSGTDGLRFFKERVGLEERNVEWLLA